MQAGLHTCFGKVPVISLFCGMSNQGNTENHQPIHSKRGVENGNWKRIAETRGNSFEREVR